MEVRKFVEIADASSISIFGDMSQNIECTLSVSRDLFVSSIVKVTGNELVVKS